MPRKSVSICKYMFLASGLLRIGAMQVNTGGIISDNNNVTYNNLREVKICEVDKMLTQINNFSNRIINYPYDFVDKLDITNSVIENYSNDNIIKIGNINPINLKELYEENMKLYNDLNENFFNNNFFDCFYLNSPLDDNIKLKIMSESISFFPFMKKLCNLYGQKHYTIKIFDFYINIEETDIIHIDSLFKKYYLLTPKKDNTLGEVSTFDNGIEKGINISATDYYFARFKNYNKRTNLNKQILLKLNESKLKNGINKEYYYDVFENSNTVVHEFNHCSKDMLELLTQKGDNDDNVDNGFLIIFENIHKIICYFLEKKNINSFLDVINFINDEKNNHELKNILLSNNSDIYQHKNFKDYELDEMLKNIRIMINFGNEDQQCKLIEVLSYVDFRYKNYKIYEKNEELIKNNLTPYGCKKVVELLAEITTNAILSGVKEDKEFAQIVLAFMYCWIDYVLKNTDTESFNKSLKPEKYIKDYYEDIIKCIKNNCNKLTHDIEYKKVRFEYNNAYFTISLTNDELENIKKSENISELALKYSRRIKFYDKLEYCYVDVISHRKIGLKTFIFKNDYKNCKSKNSQDVYVKPIIIENSEIEVNVKKIEIFLQDFYKFLYKEYDENLSKFTIFEKMQLIVFFYKLLNEKIENENYITIKGKNPLLCIAINGIINDILKTNLYNNFKNDSEKILSDEKLKELSDINKINEIDRNSTRIYVTKKYFNDIKEDKLKKNDNIDSKFLIQKKIGEDYFYLNNSEFKKTKYEKFPEQCSKISLDKEKKDLMGKKRYFTCSEFDRKYEKFMDNDKEINESSKENFQDIVKINFIDIFENYCRDYLIDNQKSKNKSIHNSKLYSYKINNEYHEIIKKNIPVNYDINGIKELLTKMIENKILINNMKKNYNEFINNYENYDKTAIYDQDIINELKNKIIKLKECLLKEIDELKEKLSDFDKFFYDKMINIRKFIVSYIPIIYDRISKNEKSKSFIEYFNNYFCTNYPLIDDEKQDSNVDK